MLKRFYHSLEEYLKANRVLVIYGPRRAGKTTLVEEFLDRTELKYRYDSGDNYGVREALQSEDFRKIKEYARGVELIVIDEAQRIPNIGMGLKIIVDQVPGIRVIAIGSSSFDLAQAVGEPLMGRKRTLMLYPMAQLELCEIYNRFDLRRNLEDYLIFGAYPEVVLAEGRKDKAEILREMVDSSLLRDVLRVENVKGSDTLYQLVKLLAFQVGQLVSQNELATQLGLSRSVVARYLDLLEKRFVIHKVQGFSRNLRNEITKKAKYYFLDNGIRNGVIGYFNKLDDRSDQGVLWENFLLSERLKWASYNREYGSRYFWRTYGGQEIDFVEEMDGKLAAYEAKWSTRKRVVAPRDWKEAYPKASYQVITPENYFDFVL